MIEFLNTLIISQDGVYGVRIIHLIMFMLTVPFVPRAIREMKELFTDETS